VTSELYTATQHCKYWSAVQLMSISHYNVYQGSYIKKKTVTIGCCTITVNITIQNCVSSQLYTETHHCSIGCCTITVNITIYCVSRQLYIATRYRKYWSVVKLLLITYYIVCQASYTQQYITVSTGLQYIHCQYYNIFCIKPVTQNNTSLSVPVSSTLTVNITIYFLLTQLHTTIHHSQYRSAVQLLSISQYILYQASYTQHITLSTCLQYNY
jgi:hypothetical protein